MSTSSKTKNELKDLLSLKVLEAYTRDVGRGIARIDYDTMDALSASTGDVIEITGKKVTVAKCLPLYPADEGKGIIRIDGLGRNNSGIALAEVVTIKKIKSLAAEKVTVAPLEAIPPIDERYLADDLESVPLIKGDKVMIPYFGGRLTFQIIEVTPAKNSVVITQKTIFEIKKKGSKIEGIEPIIKGLEMLVSFIKKEEANFTNLKAHPKLHNILIANLILESEGRLSFESAEQIITMLLKMQGD